jgi:MFS family permease
MRSLAKSRRLKRMQVVTVSLLVIICFVNYLDRSTLSVANPLIRKELGLSPGEMGILLGAFAWSYALAQVPLGPVIDRFGPRMLLGLGLIAWSAAQALAGLAGSFAQMFWLRTALGVGESPTIPCAAKACRSWFNVRERGTPMGLFMGANNLGQAISPPVITLMMLWAGWRFPFVVLGVAGLVVAGLWYAIYRDAETTRLEPADREFLTEGDQGITVQRLDFAQWRQLLKYRTAWGMIIGFGCWGYFDNMFRAWLPGYLEMERHLTIGTTGWAAMIPFTCSVLGSVTGGLTMDMLIKRFQFTPSGSARLVIVLGIGLDAFFIMLGALAGDVVTAVACISVAMWVGHMGSGCAWTLVTTSVPRNAVGSVGGLQNCAAYLGGAASPIVTGFSVELTGSFVLALLIGAGFGAVSALAYWVLAARPIPPEDFGGATAAPEG